MSLLIAVLAAFSLSPLSAVCGSDATVKLSQDDRTLASISYQVAAEGWSFASVIGQPDGTGLVKLKGGEIIVKSNATKDGDGLAISLEATPKSDVSIETSDLLVSLPLTWADGLVNVDGTDLRIPAHDGDVHFFVGAARLINLTKGNDHLSLDLGEKTQVMFQDSRRFGGAFELRLGTPFAAETWKQGEKRTYKLSIKGDSPIEVRQNKPLTIQAGDDWIPFEQMLDVKQDSALDWSPEEVVPADERIVTTTDGHFAYESTSNHRARFYGGNLVFSAAMPSHATADRVAERLMRLGYNAVRLHHFDGLLTGDEKVSTTLSKDPLDRMDYLVSALKKRGIYTTIDLYTIRKIKAGELLPRELAMDEYKAMLLVSDKARENWWTFTKNLLDHKNPYTGLKWKDDPAVAWISVVNENTLGSSIRSAGPEVKKLVNDSWQAAGMKGEYNYETKDGAVFAAALHSKAYQWMKDKIRGIGCKALLTDVNGWNDQTALQLHRNELDYIDNHSYWDHPSFLGDQWSLPTRGGSGGGSAIEALGGTLQNMALTRMPGKPFTVTEFNFVAPNRNRAEGGLLMGSLAARQGWDGLWRFGYAGSSESLEKPLALNFFDAQIDPALLASERAIIALFLRGDMGMARVQNYVRLYPNRVDAKGFSDPITENMFDVRVGTTFEPDQPTDKLPRLSNADRPALLDRDKSILRVNTSRTVGVVAPVSERVKAGPLNVVLSGSRAALWLSSLDENAIQLSHRMLLTHVTDVQNSGEAFTGEDRDVLTSWGTLPHLVRNGGAKVTLQVQQPEKVHVYRLDCAGNRLEELPVTRSIRDVSFDLSVKGPKGATLYYEIVKPI